MYIVQLSPTLATFHTFYSWGIGVRASHFLALSYNYYFARLESSTVSYMNCIPGKSILLYKIQVEKKGM